MSLCDLHHCPTTSDHRLLVLTLSRGSRLPGLRLQPEGLLCHLALFWGEGAALVIVGRGQGPAWPLGLPTTLPGDAGGKGLFASNRLAVTQGRVPDPWVLPPCSLLLLMVPPTKEALPCSSAFSNSPLFWLPDTFGVVCHDCGFREGPPLFLLFALVTSSWCPPSLLGCPHLTLAPSFPHSSWALGELLVGGTDHPEIGRAHV